MNPFAALRQKSGLSMHEVAKEIGYNERTLYRWERGETNPRKAVIDLMSKLIGTNPPQSESFTFIDLFAGIGGFRRGFEAIGGKCIYTSEWDEYSQKTYRANYPADEHDIAGDISKVIESDIPSFDVLLAGFPCQPFSLAGISKKNSLNKPHGFACEAQGTLFFDVARIINYHRPVAFLLENVKNLISHDKGKTFQVIRNVLEKDLGYKIAWKVIDAAAWVPQHRERIFIVGTREDTGFSFDNLKLPTAGSYPKLDSILHDGSDIEEPYTSKKGYASSKYTLSQNLWNYLQAYAEKHRLKGNGFGFGLFGPSNIARTLSARYYKDGSEILIKQKGKIPRRLTPRECARLMGFDREGLPLMKIPVSDTRAYKQFGNAVVVPVVEAIATLMKPHIALLVADEKPAKVKAIG